MRVRNGSILLKRVSLRQSSLPQTPQSETHFASIQEFLGHPESGFTPGESDALRLQTLKKKKTKLSYEAGL